MNEYSAKILIVEDDEEMAELMAEYLSSRDFLVEVEHTGTHASDRILNESPDLVILDLMLPGKDGVTICREVRSQFQGSILMLTASEDAIDQIVGLEVGADDFVSKPIEPRVLLARVRALLRRTQITPAPVAEQQTFRDLTINYAKRDVQLKQQSLALSTPEFDLLSLLIKQAGSIVSREQVFQSLKKIEYDGQSRFADIIVSQIRKKLGESADEYVKTVRGKGYLFIA